MSLGLPDFASAGDPRQDSAHWRVLRIAGYIALAATTVVALQRLSEVASNERAAARLSSEAAQRREAAQAEKRALNRNSDFLVATASVESRPAIVQRDLAATLPPEVRVSSLKVEYLADATARVEMTVIARTPAAYDRFLSALGKSSAFTEIRPGNESRPGLVRATLMAVHRTPAGEGR